MIQLENVTKRFPGGQEALSNLDLSVDKGEMVFVTGHSGAGKSTLLRLIALIERPTSGQVIVDGQNTRRVRRRKIPKYRRQIGMVFQDHKLLYDRPVFDNVALPLIIAGVSHRDAGRRVRAALDQVSLLHKERQQPETLSAGEQQRVEPHLQVHFGNADSDDAQCIDQHRREMQCGGRSCRGTHSFREHCLVAVRVVER